MMSIRSPIGGRDEIMLPPAVSFLIMIDGGDLNEGYETMS
jgi:hypothetical protein